MLVIGIDCSTNFKKIGLARGDFSETSRNRLLDADCLISRESIVEKLVSWITKDKACLLAVDAPLGWPAPFGSALSSHRAGHSLSDDSNRLFRRETDRFVKKQIGKQPLDIGADRIARTAHAALDLLEELRREANLKLPLAWSHEIAHASVVEVYPASTLSVHGLRSSRYKQVPQANTRQEIVDGLSHRMVISADIVPGLLASDDVLDAAVCVLAGFDFLEGHALPPEDLKLAAKEGWIWVRSPAI